MSGLAVLLAGLVASPALAATTPIDTSACSDPQLSQPFLSASDTNWYALAPGETPGNFGGGGWTLGGGAKITTSRLANGQTGSVLELPSGSRAVSPAVCVASNYTTARTMIGNVLGGGDGIRFYVSYAGTKTWDKPQNAGHVRGSATGWSLSDPLEVHPGDLPGWQLVRFTFEASNASGQIYDFYVDPRMT